LPVHHHLVHPPAQQIRADRPLQVVDEAVHLLVWRGPVEVAALVGHVAVQRHDRRVDQPADWRDSSIFLTMGLGTLGCHARYASRKGTGHSTSQSTRVPNADAPDNTRSDSSSTRRCITRSRGMPNAWPNGNSTPTLRGARRSSATAGRSVLTAEGTRAA